MADTLPRPLRKPIPLWTPERGAALVLALLQHPLALGGGRVSRRCWVAARFLARRARRVYSRRAAVRYRRIGSTHG